MFWKEVKYAFLFINCIYFFVDIKNTKMDPNTKRYNDLVSTYKKTYPDLKTAFPEQKAQILWNDVKNDFKKYEDTLVDLQKKIQRRQSKQLSFWSNLQSKPVEHPKPLAAKLSSGQKQKQSVTKPVESI